MRRVLARRPPITARTATGAQWLLFKPYSKSELFAVVKQATGRAASKV